MEPSYRNYLEPVSTSFRLEPLDSVELECIDASGRTVPIKGQVCRATPVRLEIELAAVSVSDAGLQGGTPVFVAFVRQGLLYGFDTTDLADPQFPLIFLKPPDRFFRIQRREYFRLKVDFPLEYAISPETSDRPETWQPGRVIELSARGLKMLIDAPLLPDTQVSLRFRLPAPPTPMAIQGIVLRVVEQHEHKTLLVAFYPDVPEKWRDAIMQYLTIAQRAMLRGERVP